MAAHHLADKFRTNILKLEMKSMPQSRSSDRYSSSLTDTASTSFELCEEDYVDRSNHRTISDLQSIATKMNSDGYLDECIRIYVSERSCALIRSFQRLKVHELSQRSARKLDQGSLKSIVRDWNRSAKICITFLFTHEKRLCEQIFQGLGNAPRDACFIETVKVPATRLFNVAEALCGVNPSSEKLFRILDLHQALSGLLPLTNDLFNSESSECIRVRPAQILSNLAESIRRIMTDFENDVLQEQSPFLPTPEIHRLTKYVMNHIRQMSEYKQTLAEVIKSKPLTDEDGSEAVDFAEFEEQTPLSLHFIRIISQLISKLEVKSKLYKDASSEHFFIMNNVHYIVQMIETSSELREIIGEQYMKTLSQKLRQAKANYLQLTFHKILKCLRAEGLNGSRVFSSKAKKLTSRLKSFNIRFEEVQQDLANVVVTDAQLLVDLRKSVLDKLIPAYSSFLEEFEIVRGSPKQPASSHQHIKYSTKQLETAILSFFSGSSKPGAC